MIDDKLKIQVKERHDIIHVPNGKFIYDFVAEHQNYTNYGLIFDVKRTNNITNYRYQVLYNSTTHFNSTERHSLSMRIVSIARGLDEAIGMYFFLYLFIKKIDQKFIQYLFKILLKYYIFN